MNASSAHGRSMRRTAQLCLTCRTTQCILSRCRYERSQHALTFMGARFSLAISPGNRCVRLRARGAMTRITAAQPRARNLIPNGTLQS